MNCGKEDRERERAMLSEMHSDGIEGKPSSSERSTTNLLLSRCQEAGGTGSAAAGIGARFGVPAVHEKPLGHSRWHQALLWEQGWERLGAAGVSSGMD